MAKKKATKDETVDKNEVAKKKADELFNDVLSVAAPKKSEEKPKEVKETKADAAGNAWLEEQVQSLSEQVEVLEQKLAEKTLDYQKLLASKKTGGAAPHAAAAQSDSEIAKGVKIMFEELRSAYEGSNPTRTRYTDAKIKILLDKFLKLFPFLLEGRKVVR